jgi:hypothetical protein
VFVIYGVDEMSEDFGGATHLALLTRDEALDLEFRDFVREDEDAPARFEDRLVVVESFPELARAKGITAAEYLGRELIGNFLLANPGHFFPFLPQHEVAYVGPVQGGAPTGPGTGGEVGGGCGAGPLWPSGGHPDLGRGGRPGEGQGPGPGGGLPGPEGPLAETLTGGGKTRPRRMCP